MSLDYKFLKPNEERQIVRDRIAAMEREYVGHQATLANAQALLAVVGLDDDTRTQAEQQVTLSNEQIASIKAMHPALVAMHNRLNAPPSSSASPTPPKEVATHGTP